MSGSSFYPPGQLTRCVAAAAGNKMPKRSLRELADEFGVSMHQLMGVMSHDPEAPKACLRSHPSRGAGANSYYEPKAMRAWWQKHQLAQAERATAAIKNVATKKEK